MRLSTLLPALGLATQALAIPLSCNKHVNEMSLAESDAAVAEYFAKLEPATKRALLHEITGPEAGVDVHSRSPIGPPHNGAFCISFVLTRSVCWSPLGRRDFSRYTRSRSPRILRLLVARRLPRLPPLAQRAHHVRRYELAPADGRRRPRAHEDAAGGQPRRKYIHRRYRGGRIRPPNQHDSRRKGSHRFPRRGYVNVSWFLKRVLSEAQTALLSAWMFFSSMRSG